MPWDNNIIEDSQVQAAHAALVTRGTRGSVIYFGGFTSVFEDFVNAAPSSVFDIATGSISPIVQASLATSNIFCGGHALLADGRWLIAGGTVGTAEEIEGGGHAGHYPGERTCWEYLPSNLAYSPIADLRFQPGSSTKGGGRWYPTVITLGNGEALAVAGHPHVTDDFPSPDNRRHNNNVPERYSPGTGLWTLLYEGDDHTTEINGVESDGYPRIHLLPNGRVFFATTVKGVNRFYNPFAGTFYDDEIAAPGGIYNKGSRSTSVLMPLLPADGYGARVLVAGASSPRKINLFAGGFTWEAAGVRQLVPNWGGTAPVRNHLCSVILPTGQIFFCGGCEDDGDRDATAVFEGEIYTPDINWGTGVWGNGGGTWDTVDQAQIIRHYHFTALLLPDGRVWTAGSDPGRKEIEIYEPPYVAQANRPVITDSPSNVRYGQQFFIQTPQAGSIERVGLIRCGSVTHAFDSDQRYVGLTFLEVQAGVLRATAPPNGNVAPPGFYMLWIVDGQDRPCQVAPFIRVGNQSCHIKLDVSTYSLLEVQALGTPGAEFPDAFHIVFEGFRPDEVFPPIVTVRRPDNTAVPGMEVQFFKIAYEGNPTEKDVAQIVRYSYRVRFNNTQAFDQIPDDDDFQNLTLRAEMGLHVCQSTLTLSKNPNPFMRDGYPHWLSIDLRVFKTKPGEALSAGLEHGSGGNAPFTYIQGLLATYNSLPADDSHPFLQLPTDQETNRLALYSEDDNGDPIYNYAVAKVRYRAPVGADAEDVRVFFRLCTTGWTGLEYDLNTTYRREGEGANAAPLLGLTGAEINFIPCFAEERAADMETQTDATNRRTLQGNGAQEVHGYFGCWLDMNQDVPRFPLEPGGGNGPFAGDLKSIQELMRGLHQCLVAEIHYPPDPVLNGVTPGSSDNLAQRNILLDDSDNPGAFSTHLVHHTFEIKPSIVPLTAAGASTSIFPDELMVDWGNLPRDTRAEFYFPDVDLEAVLAAAAARQGPPNLALAGTGTLRCRVTDVAYIPIPGPRATNIPGLLTLQLPPNLVKGQRFSIVVRQVQGRSRRVIGTFQFDIIVDSADQILPRATRNLAVLRHIAASIPKANRWYPIFKRYLGDLAGRIRELGGNPDAIEPSPTGGARPGKQPPHPHPDPCAPTPGRERHTGKVSQMLYDCYGDFEGFVLDECPGERVFMCRERAMENLIRHACAERLRVTVFVRSDDCTRPVRIALHC
jgi:hypothetical protein